MSGYRIVSFDGGPSALTMLPCLIEIERNHPGFLAATDLFAGASSGAWVSLYLARNMALVDAGKMTGEELLASCFAFLKESLAMMRPLQPSTAWVDFMLGKAPLLDYSRVQALMNDPAIYGLDTLGSLARRVVVIAGRMSSPWSPRVYDSAARADAAQPLDDVALRSGSFPMVFPIRDGEVDGAMYTNNPAMVALVQAMAGADGVGPVSPASTRLFTLGSDDGCSHLSNLWMPGSHTAAAPPEAASAPPEPLELTDVRRKLGAVESHLDEAVDQVEKIVSALRAQDPPVIDERTAEGMRQIVPRLQSRARATRHGLMTLTEASAPIEAAAPPPPEQLWGWLAWMAAPLNFLYVVQVLLNSQGRGVGEQCSRLLGDRSLRLGPVTLLPTNEAAMLLILGLDQLVIDCGELTAALWRVTKPRWFASWLDFQPGFGATLSWIESGWMPAAE